MTAECLTADRLSAAEMERFLHRRRRIGYASLVSQKALAPLLGYLRALGAVPAAPPPPVPTGSVGTMLERYRRHLLLERGLAAETATRYVNDVHEFLSENCSPERGDFSHLSTGDVTAFALAVCNAKPVRHSEEHDRRAVLAAPISAS